LAGLFSSKNLTRHKQGHELLLDTDPPAIASSPASQARPAFACGAADSGRARRGGLGHERAGEHRWLRFLN